MINQISPELKKISPVRKIITICPDGTQIWRDETAQDRLLNILWENEKAKKLPIKELKDYGLYIKSHTEAPDYENECEAGSIDEAAKIFHSKLGEAKADWSPADLKEFIVEE